MFFAGKTEEDVKRVVDICPLGRLGQTEDVAPLVGFLATDAADWEGVQLKLEIHTATAQSVKGRALRKAGRRVFTWT
ncbi:hypothetical protein AAC387_Pa02g0742 [Persea americana]